MVPKEIYCKIKPLIETYADKDLTPRFEPHITVLGGLEFKSIEEATAFFNAIPQLNLPLEVKLSGIDGQPDRWSKALYAIVEKSDPLESLYNDICVLSGKPRGGLPVFHATLIYGELSQDTINYYKDLPNLAQLVGLCGNVVEIQLWKTPGHDVTNWHPVTSRTTSY
jgi:hypothetical protein